MQEAQETIDKLVSDESEAELEVIKMAKNHKNDANVAPEMAKMSKNPTPKNEPIVK